MQNLLIITNDKLYKGKSNFFTSNNDLNNTINSFSKNFKIFLLSRINYNKRIFKLDSNKLKITNLINLLLTKNKIKRMLMNSITPFNFFCFLILSVRFNLKGYVYLRSDGFKEYKIKLGYFGYIIYYIMFKYITKRLKILSVSKSFTNLKKVKLILPSEINYQWQKNKKIKKINKKKIQLLYIGRYKKEKGIKNFEKLISKTSFDYQLKIVGLEKVKVSLDKQIQYYKETNNVNSLIKFYDSCDIFILPSYTEGFPKVIQESLSRIRPIVIFNEIKFLKKISYGIFSCNRTSRDLEKNIRFIINNYSLISLKIKNGSKVVNKYDYQKKLNKLFI